MHSHFLPSSWPDFCASYGGDAWPSMRHAGELPAGTFGYNRPCDAMLMSGGRDFRPVTRACWDVQARLDDLDLAGIDVQLISATPILFQWQRDAAVCADVSRHFNDAAVEMCEASAGRLRALCQVPLQDVDASCLELERAMSLGHVGVHIGNHVGSKDLDDAGLVTFLQHCASLNAPVLVHPWDMDPLDGRLDHYMMGWTVGMPLETHLSITSMILGGAFDQLPTNLNLCFAHGGGAFAFLLGRLENAWHERSIARGKSLHPPSHYLNRFSVDSAVFDHKALQLLVDTMGAKRVMLGSDYPFPLGEQQIGSLVRTSSTLSEQERDQILGGNAVAFFGLQEQEQEQEQQLEVEKETGVGLDLEMPPLRIISPPSSFPPPPLPQEQPAVLSAQDGSSSVLSAEEAERWAPSTTTSTPPRHHRPRPPSTLIPPSFPRAIAPPMARTLYYGRQAAYGGVRLLPRRRHLSSASPSSSSRAYSAAVLSTGHSAEATWFDDMTTPSMASAPPSSEYIAVRNHIGGAPCDSFGWLPLIDQASGNERGRVVNSSAPDVDVAVSVAQRSLQGGEWAHASPAERAAVLFRAASLLEAEAETFALAESKDTGKPLRLARNLDVSRAVANFRFFAGLAEHSTAGIARDGGGQNRGFGADSALSYTVRKPIGVVGLVTPWNLPLYLLTWKLAPALAMGNSIVAKPSELTPTTASLLAGLMERAGLPRGVFNVVHGTGQEAGAALCKHPDVAALSFTGGTSTGAAVAAAVAPRFAKLSLELGGKNALLVFSDCDFEATVEGAVRASFLNSGQICLCASRILIERTEDGFYERFSEAFAARARQLVLGHPTDESSDMGPLISASQLDKVQGYVGDALSGGGGEVTALSGGPNDQRAAAAVRANGDGHWCAPTVLDGCGIGDRIATEEVFGPVVTLHPFESAEEAVIMANATKYGLSASVWTDNVQTAHDVAELLEAGTVWVNCWLHRQLHMPFGGLKASGVAREGGEMSLDFYSETTTIALKMGQRKPPPMPGIRKGAAVAEAVAVLPPSLQQPQQQLARGSVLSAEEVERWAPSTSTPPPRHHRPSPPPSTLQTPPLPPALRTGH